jgi:hypothetical protein
MFHPLRMFRLSAVAGIFVVGAANAALGLDLASTLLLGGALVCVPLALALVAELEPTMRRRSYSVAAFCQPPAAICLVCAFAWPPGAMAAGLSLPWLGFGLLAAFLGFERAWRRARASVAEGCIAAGLIFLLVGAGWTTLSRFGARPLGFPDVIVLLTGVHFHYAGLVLPVLTGLAGRAKSGVLARLATCGVVTGVPLVAFGITVGRYVPLIEALAAWFMTLAALMAAAVQLRYARQCPRLEGTLLLVSALALVAGVALAACYALSVYLHQYWFTIDQMILWHGTVNACGYALLGLLGWTVHEQSGPRPIDAASGSHALLAAGSYAVSR